MLCTVLGLHAMYSTQSPCYVQYDAMYSMLGLHAMYSTKEVLHMPVVQLGVEAVGVDAQLLTAVIHLQQLALRQCCIQCCRTVRAVKEAKACCRVDQVLLTVPLGLLLMAVGAAGRALPTCGLAGEVAVQHECAKASFCALCYDIPIAGDAEGVGHSAEEAGAVGAKVGIKMVEVLRPLQSYFQRPLLPTLLPLHW